MSNPGRTPLIPGEIVDLLARAELKGVKEDVHDLAVKVDGLASKGDIASLTVSIAAIATKQDQATKPQYGLVVSIATFSVLMITVIGGFAYWPIQRDTARLETGLSAVLERGVFQKQYDADSARVADLVKGLRSDVNISIQQQRYNTDQDRLNSTLNDIRARFAPKTEVEATFRERQHQIDGNETRIEQLRLRTYDTQGRLSKLEEGLKAVEKITDLLVVRMNSLRDRIGK